MKTSFILAALAVASVASAFDCPSPSDVEVACGSVDNSPLACDQAYIDNYAVCQCRGGSTTFHEYSANVEELIEGCGQTSLTNPFGNPTQFKRAAALDDAPENIMTTDDHISGGGIAGIVIGLLAAAGLAGALGWCWRKKRHAHMSPYHHNLHHPYANDLETGPGTGGGVLGGHHHHGGPGHTVVTEKVEPVVVRSGHGPGASTSQTGTGSATQLPTQPNQPYSANPRTGDGIAAPNTTTTTTTAGPYA